MLKLREKLKSHLTLHVHIYFIIHLMLQKLDSPIVFHWTGLVCRSIISTGVDCSEMFTCLPVLLSSLSVVKKEFGKGSRQYSGTKGSHGP